MRHITILGIANTDLSVVKTKSVDYSLIAAETIKTNAREATGKRLALIDDEINAPLTLGTSLASLLSVFFTTRTSPVA